MPSRYLPHLVILLSAALLAACAAVPVVPGKYPLKPQQSVAIAPNVTVTYDSFSDSRCPPNTQCMWAGQLAFRFLVAGPGGEQEVTLGPDQLSAQPKTLRGATIALDPAAIPPARAAGTMRPGDGIPVTLVVRAQ